MNKKGGLQLIILGSLIVLTGIGMYFMNVLGAVGLITLGGLVELAGLLFYFKKR
jgi:hypothetical protein